VERKITIEKALEDLKRVAKKFETLGHGSDIDRLAQLVIQPLQVLQNRLEKPVILKMLYLDNKEAVNLLPDGVVELVQQLCNGQISPEDARTELGGMVEMYRQAFDRMGITPQFSRALSMKR
jgi:hypothetical protein